MLPNEASIRCFNAVGGSPEYTRDGETGWLNRSNDAAGFAAILRTAAEHPRQVVDLNASILERRAQLIKPMSAHLDELDEKIGRAHV